MTSAKPQILIIEPFFGGSHKQLIDTLVECEYGESNQKRSYQIYTYFLLSIGLNLADYEIFSLPAKKWHWRARTSALYFSQLIPPEHDYKVLFTSSVLNLAELIGVRPDLVSCRKIVYFHENQLVYPVREVKERDCQYGLNEILTW